MELIIQDLEGRELTKAEAMDMVIVGVRINDAEKKIMLTVKEQD